MLTDNHRDGGDYGELSYMSEMFGKQICPISERWCCGGFMEQVVKNNRRCMACFVADEAEPSSELRRAELIAALALISVGVERGGESVVSVRDQFTCCDFQHCYIVADHAFLGIRLLDYR